MDLLLLTDDEAVALAVDAGTFWPGVLPTVELDDAARLAEASFRGHRSLLCRDLLTAEGRAAAPVAELAGALAGRTDRVDVFLADARFRRASWALATSSYPAAGDWVIETVTGSGVHTVSRQPAEVNRAYLEALLTAAVADGPPREDLVTDERSAIWMCLGTGDQNGPLVAARRDELCLVRRGGSEPVAEPVVDPHAVDEVNALVQVLLDAAVGSVPAV